MAIQENWKLGSSLNTKMPTDAQLHTMTRRFQNQNGVLIRSLSDGELETNHRLKMNSCENEPAAAAARGDELVRRSSDDDNETLLHDHHDHIIDISPSATSPRCVGRRNTVAMKYLVPTLLLLVGIKYQVSPDFLFLKNAVQIGCFVGSICVYWPTVQIMEKWSHSKPKLTNILNCSVVACKVLSVFSLMSLLFPWHLPLPVFITSVFFGFVLTAIMVVWYVVGSE